MKTYIHDDDDDMIGFEKIANGRTDGVGIFEEISEVFDDAKEGEKRKACEWCRTLLFR